MNWLRCPYLIQTNGRNGLTAVQRIDAETRYAPSRPTLQGSPVLSLVAFIKSGTL